MCLLNVCVQGKEYVHMFVHVHVQCKEYYVHTCADQRVVTQSIIAERLSIYETADPASHLA